MYEIHRYSFCFYRLAKFVDKFGARPSGSVVLEDSIDYMIQLTQEEGITDITLEDVEVLSKKWC